MTWDPIFPAWLVVLFMLALGGFAVWCLVRSTGRSRRLGWLLRALAVLMVGIACLRPGFGSQEAPVVESAVDVVFVVDTTASMIAEDWNGEQPRMDGVKQDIMALAAAHPGARFAMVEFASQAVQTLPFTSDTSALQAVVDVLQPEVTRYSKGSSIGIAAQMVHDVLARAQQADPSRARVVYYLGDGEQTSQTQPESFAESASLVTAGAVLGYGTAEGGRMRETTSSFSTAAPTYIQDRSTGQDARSKIDETALQTIATQLGVGYQHRTAATPVSPAAVEATTMQASTTNDVERAFDLYWIFAIAAFLLLLADVWRMSRALAELREARGALPDD